MKIEFPDDPDNPVYTCTENTLFIERIMSHGSDNTLDINKFKMILQDFIYLKMDLLPINRRTQCVHRRIHDHIIAVK